MPLDLDARGGPSPHPHATLLVASHAGRSFPEKITAKIEQEIVVGKRVRRALSLTMEDFDSDSVGLLLDAWDRAMADDKSEFFTMLFKDKVYRLTNARCLDYFDAAEHQHLWFDDVDWENVKLEHVKTMLDKISHARRLGVRYSSVFIGK